MTRRRRRQERRRRADQAPRLYKQGNQEPRLLPHTHRLRRPPEDFEPPGNGTFRTPRRRMERALLNLVAADRVLRRRLAYASPWQVHLTHAPCALRTGSSTGKVSDSAFAGELSRRYGLGGVVGDLRSAVEKHRRCRRYIMAWVL